MKRKQLFVVCALLAGLPVVCVRDARAQVNPFARRNETTGTLGLTVADAGLADALGIHAMLSARRRIGISTELLFADDFMAAGGILQIRVGPKEPTFVNWALALHSIRVSHSNLVDRDGTNADRIAWANGGGFTVSLPLRGSRVTSAVVGNAFGGVVSDRVENDSTIGVSSERKDTAPYFTAGFGLWIGFGELAASGEITTAAREGIIDGRFLVRLSYMIR